MCLAVLRLTSLTTQLFFWRVFFCRSVVVVVVVCGWTVGRAVPPADRRQEQSPSDRRAIRQQYRALIREAESASTFFFSPFFRRACRLSLNLLLGTTGARDDIVDASSNKLQKVTTVGDQIFERGAKRACVPRARVCLLLLRRSEQRR